MSSLRVAFPGSRRSVGAAAATIVASGLAIAICLAGVGVETGRLAVIVALSLTVAAANIAPIAAAVTAGVLTQFTASYPDYTSPFAVLALIALTAVLAFRLPVWAGALGAMTLWYLAQTELAAGVWVPSDSATAGLFGVLTLAAAAAGWALRHSNARRKDEAERLQRRIEEERELTVLALHGSVASSLTSVVLRSEALAMSGDTEVAEAAQRIALDARRSMQEVRDLIRFMRDEHPLRACDTVPTISVAEAFSSLAEDLRGHGFHVVESGINHNVVGDATLPSAERLCRELTTNILKYGDINRPVIVAALRNEDSLTIAVQNSFSEKQHQPHMTSGLGLEEARALVADNGATLEWHAEGGSWRYELTLPDVP